VGKPRQACKRSSKISSPDNLLDLVQKRLISRAETCPLRIPLSGSLWLLERAAAMFAPAVVVDIHDNTAVRINRLAASAELEEAVFDHA